MKIDSGNRSFLALLAISLLGLYLTLGAGACVLLSLVGYELATGGLDALGDHGAATWPALAFLALVAAGTVAGFRSFLLQLRASARLAHRVRDLTVPPPPALGGASERASLAGRVRMVDSAERFSFAYGALTPRIAISRGLVETASAEELDAVLVHERYHVRNLDPLKVLLARVLPAALFYLPALRDLRARYIAGRELAADRRALASCGRRPLAGALLKVVETPRWPELSTAAAIGGADLLDMRIAQLETGGEPPAAAIEPRLVALSAAGAATLAAVFTLAVVGLGGADAVMEEAMPGARIGALDVALALACVLPWIGAGWVGYRWLAHRARV